MHKLTHNNIEFREGSKVEVLGHDSAWISGTLKYDGFCGWHFEPESEEGETLILDWNQVRIAEGKIKNKTP